ncbi:hypothetical protein [Nitrosomonas eutropha]|nr:hypothetical protein [Nitrosomonas eutropha]MXS81155.1 hypothetical protein [Nitrosomonas sp. GH22]
MEKLSHACTSVQYSNPSFIYPFASTAGYYLAVGALLHIRFPCSDTPRLRASAAAINFPAVNFVVSSSTKCP